MTLLSGVLATSIVFRCLRSDIVRGTIAAGASIVVGDTTGVAKLVSGILGNEAAAALGRTVDHYLEQLPPDTASELTHDIERIFQNAVALALEEIGGDACFPAAWLKARALPPAGITYGDLPGHQATFRTKDDGNCTPSYPAMPLHQWGGREDAVHHPARSDHPPASGRRWRRRHSAVGGDATGRQLGPKEDRAIHKNLAQSMWCW